MICKNTNRKNWRRAGTHTGTTFNQYNSEIEKTKWKLLKKVLDSVENQ